MLHKLPKEVLEIVALHLENHQYHKLRLASSTPRLELIQVQTFKMFQSSSNTNNQSLEIPEELIQTSLDCFGDEMFLFFVKEWMVSDFVRSLRYIAKVSIPTQNQVLREFNNIYNRSTHAMILAFLEVYAIENTFEENYRFLIQLASLAGALTLVRRLLREYQVDPSVNCDYCIRIASFYGRSDVVEELCKHPKVDPSAVSNAAIILAASECHAKVVEILLRHPKVDPTDDGYRAIRAAARGGHSSIVEMLLEDPRFNHADSFHESILHGWLDELVPLIPRLLKSPLVDPSVGQNYALRKMVSEDYVEVVEILLRDPRVDPSALENDAIHCASVNNNFKIVQILLKDSRVDPKSCFLPTMPKVSPDMTELLMKDPRMNDFSNEASEALD